MDEGLILWYSNIHDEYLNNDENLSFIISQLLAAEQTKIRSFKFQEDKKRALLSILLQHGLIHEKFLFRNKHDYTIQRTVEVSNLYGLFGWHITLFICLEQAFRSLQTQNYWILEL